MMAISGAVFASTGNYVALLIAAIVGVISPSGNEIGPFRAVEESTLAQYVSRDSKCLLDKKARYHLGGISQDNLSRLRCPLPPLS
jgi:hypothetical protein